ncbi:hypothetical protein HXX76_008887 [Chlamydomonas incerta]|uniref:Uncharacterized protein n=1 Tax=Chlamydomonas incerta TaxID=51695 RepID=A0A835SW02_CHLIN|nr:hypothetical protein HXX76_008887 [Chlamydomonas incerta]|eukprot:KAG2432542.1 hypothetical protein HXX76_008887 [Chlamydomonas incerta]
MMAKSLRRGPLCQARERDVHGGFHFSGPGPAWSRFASVRLSVTSPRQCLSAQREDRRLVPATIRAATVEVDLLADESYLTGPALLRQVLGRQILGKIAAQAPADALALKKLGVTRLRAPPPPASFLALEAELTAAAAAGADPAAALRRHLGPEERYGGWVNSAGKRCLLAPSERVQRFAAVAAANGNGNGDARVVDGSGPGELERWLVSLFVALEEQLAPQVALSPHCLFHAHLFLAQPPNPDTAPVAVESFGRRPAAAASASPASPAASPRRQGHAAAASAYAGADPACGLGLLFHAAEYPAHDPQHFPFQLGYCQEDSHVVFSPHRMATRNLLWYHGHLAQLDVGEGLPARGLLWPETQELCTVYESDLGLPLADLTLALDPEAAEAWRRRRRERSKRRRGAHGGDGAAEEGVALLVNVRGSGWPQ